MKTNSLNSLRSILSASLALAAFSTTLLAGPGPQYWSKSTTPPPAVKEQAKPKAPGPAKCDGCKTTTKWIISDRGPAGKGVPGASIAERKHECKGCSGTVVTEKRTTTGTMVHSEKCLALLCCK